MGAIWILVFTFAFPDGSLGGGLAGVYPSEDICQRESQGKVPEIMSNFAFESDNFPTMALHCVAQPLPRGLPKV